ncbi:MAG: S1 family peptidase, partial [Anaerolineae bacterium]|nr:S1 family peptidase [Anaerolineae bacterium]
MRSRDRIIWSVVVLALLFTMGFAVSAQSESVTVEDRAGFRRPTAEMLELGGDIRGDVETRAALGLDADLALVSALRGSPGDEGTDRFGIPLTETEAEEVQARFAFAAAAHEAVLPFVESLPTFAGAFFDHQAGGELVILLTAADDLAQAEILSLAPAGRRTKVELVEYTQAQLREALPRARAAWTAIGGPEAYAVVVDTPANAIRIDVDPVNLEEAEKLAAGVGAAIDLPVFVAVGERPQESACTDRENCTSPMRGGIVIYHTKSPGVIGQCTMGFHIQVGSDEQFVTAGHCGYSGSNNWYHTGYGYVGNERNTQYYNNGRDIMTVQISDSQDSSILYSGTVAVNATWDPYVGEGLCASRGVSST